MTLEKIEDNFYQTSEKLINLLDNNEHLTLSLRGEHSLFIRFNSSQNRQSTHVTNGRLSMNYIFGNQTATLEFPFTGNLERDLDIGSKYLRELKTVVPQLPEDPFIIVPKSHGFSRDVHPGQLLSLSDATALILEPTQDIDFTGILSSGSLFRGNINSAGQKHWFSSETFSLDYCVSGPGKSGSGKNAVKATYGGKQWDQSTFESKLKESQNQLTLFDNPSKRLSPGRFNAYLAPAATAELAQMFSWGAVSEAAIQRGQSCVTQFNRHQQLFSKKFRLCENFDLGFVPRFNDLGELAPHQVNLISDGMLSNTLVSSKTAKEYQCPTNAANATETLRTPEIAPGDLKSEMILSNLDTGLYISNLHYLNWSDLPAGRITGMTRYGCFWVEHGNLVSPIEHLRFDETLFHFFGKTLIALTDFQETLPETLTYEERSLGGALMPGLLVEDLSFTL